MGKMRSSKYDVTTAYGLCQDYLPPDGALCIGEDYVIMSQCAHNKAIRVAAEGTVSVTDISQTQNITIVGLPDYVNNEFKIALYAKETQRYLCFNDNWKLVGMKELRDTCYFNETIVHGYFVFRSVVDLQRRVGFTQRGKPVGPKKTVNEACYLFTKIEADQFFHQHIRQKWRESAAIVAATTSTTKSTTSSSPTSSSSTATAAATSQQQQRANNRKGSRNKNNRNKKHNNQNQKLQQQQEHLKVSQQQQQQQQHQTQNENTRERVQHQVRHHHNDPTLVARRQQHEHKQKRRQRNRPRETASAPASSSSSSNRLPQHMSPTATTKLATSLIKTPTTASMRQHATQTPTTPTATATATAANSYKQHAIAPANRVVDKSTAATATRNMLASTTTVANRRKGRRRKAGGGKRRIKEHQQYQHEPKEYLQQQHVAPTLATLQTTSNSDDFIASSMSTTYEDVYNSSSDWTTWLATPTQTFDAFSSPSSSTFEVTASDADSDVAATVTTAAESSSSSSSTTQNDISDYTYESSSEQQSVDTTASTTSSLHDHSNMLLSSSSSSSTVITPNSISTDEVATQNSTINAYATTAASDAWSTFITELEASNETEFTNFDAVATTNKVVASDDVGNMLPTTYETKVNVDTDNVEASGAAATAAATDSDDIATTTSIESESERSSSSSSSSSWPLLSTVATKHFEDESWSTAHEHVAETQLQNTSNVPYQYIAGTAATYANPTLATLLYNKWHTTQQHTNPYATDASIATTKRATATTKLLNVAATSTVNSNNNNNNKNDRLTDYQLNTSIKQEQPASPTQKNSRHRNLSSNDISTANSNNIEYQHQQLLTHGDSNKQQSSQRVKSQFHSDLLHSSTATIEMRQTEKQIPTTMTTTMTSVANVSAIPTVVNAFQNDLLSIHKNINHSNMNNTLTEITTPTTTTSTGTSTLSSSSSSSSPGTASFTTATTKQSLRISTQKLLATPFHQLTYVRNEAGDIDIDSIDNISVYPDLFSDESSLDDNDGDLHSRNTSNNSTTKNTNNSRLTFVSGFLPTSATATLPESIRIAQIKINKERERLLGMRRLFRNYA